MKRIKKIENNWTEFGTADPYWSVLTYPNCINNKWDVNKFYETGERHFENIKKDFEEYLHPSYYTAIDFGCGPGRITFQLAEISNNVTGIDISAPMIELANQRNESQKKCKFIVNTETNLKFINSDSVDLIFSYITLQHNPPKIIYQYLNEFIRISKKESGHILFNLVSSPPLTYKILHYIFGQKMLNKIRKLRYNKKSAMEMNWINEKTIIKHFNNNDFKLLKIINDIGVGNNWKSNFYLFENNKTSSTNN